MLYNSNHNIVVNGSFVISCKTSSSKDNWISLCMHFRRSSLSSSNKIASKAFLLFSTFNNPGWTNKNHIFTCYRLKSFFLSNFSSSNFCKKKSGKTNIKSINNWKLMQNRYDGQIWARNPDINLLQDYLLIQTKSEITSNHT